MTFRNLLHVTMGNTLIETVSKSDNSRIRMTDTEWLLSHNEEFFNAKVISLHITKTWQTQKPLMIVMINI